MESLPGNWKDFIEVMLRK
ncbi:protein YpfM [Citrobacter freundii]